MHSGERWRLGHRPSLDGLRGIAISLVFAGHAGVPGLDRTGGAVGVTVFFTLSGFLITTLLADDLERFGRVRFGRFYRHRALRLAPAPLTFVAIVALVGLTVPGADVHAATVLGSLFYVSNYVVQGGTPDWLGHTWSLAIEEQFYLLWPPLLVLLTRWLKRPRIIAMVVLYLAAGSALARFALWRANDQERSWRIYYGLDTRADALLIGCALALLIREVRREQTRPWLVASGLGMVALALTWESPLRVVTATPFVVAVGTALALVGTAQGSGFRPLAWAPLAWVGRRSYGLYLWHYPVTLVAAEALPWSWWERLPITAAVSLALTVASWRLVEAPFLRLKDRPAPRVELEPIEPARA